MLMKIKNSIFNVLYIIVIIYLLIFIPSFWGYHPLAVISGSMEPTLNVGGLLYYHEQDLSDFDKNDILVYQTQNHIISHRVMDKVENGFITKGDANKSIDSSVVNNEQVLGKGTDWCIPFLGFFADYIYTHKYILFVIVATLIVDLCNDYYRLHKKKVGLIDEKN